MGFPGGDPPFRGATGRCRGGDFLYETYIWDARDRDGGFIPFLLSLPGGHRISLRYASGEGAWQNTMPSSVYNMFKEGDTRREGTVIVYADEAKKVAEMVAKGELPAGSAFQVSDQQENYEAWGTIRFIRERRRRLR